MLIARKAGTLRTSRIADAVILGDRVVHFPEAMFLSIRLANEIQITPAASVVSVAAHVSRTSGCSALAGTCAFNRLTAPSNVQAVHVLIVSVLIFPMTLGHKVAVGLNITLSFETLRIEETRHRHVEIHLIGRTIGVIGRIVRFHEPSLLIHRYSRFGYI